MEKSSTQAKSLAHHDIERVLDYLEHEIQITPQVLEDLHRYIFRKLRVPHLSNEICEAVDLVQDARKWYRALYKLGPKPSSDTRNASVKRSQEELDIQRKRLELVVRRDNLDRSDAPYGVLQRQIDTLDEKLSRLQEARDGMLAQEYERQLSIQRLEAKGEELGFAANAQRAIRFLNKVASAVPRESF